MSYGRFSMINRRYCNGVEDIAESKNVMGDKAEGKDKKEPL